MRSFNRLQKHENSRLSNLCCLCAPKPLYDARRVGVSIMPRNRLLVQLDEELLQARESLRFWRDQMLLLSESEFQVAARRQILHREAEIQRLLETQES